MLLLGLNISYFTILHFILNYRLIFSKAITYNQHVMIKKYKNYGRRNERLLSYCSFTHCNSQ